MINEMLLDNEIPTKVTIEEIETTYRKVLEDLNLTEREFYILKTYI